MTGDLRLDAGNVDRFLNFGGTSYGWRIGYLGSGSDDANYLAFQSGGTTGTYMDVLKFGLISKTALFSGPISAGTGLFTGTVTVATPTATNHATTKAYVDSAVSSAAPKWTTTVVLILT